MKDTRAGLERVLIYLWDLKL